MHTYRLRISTYYVKILSSAQLMSLECFHAARSTLRSGLGSTIVVQTLKEESRRGMGVGQQVNFFDSNKKHQKHITRRYCGPFESKKRRISPKMQLLLVHFIGGFNHACCERV